MPQLLVGLVYCLSRGDLVMVLAKNGICDFGWPAPDFTLKGVKAGRQARRLIGRFTLSKPDRLCYMGFDASRLFLGSSAVEQPAVNRLVAGSNPARGAKYR